LIAWFWAWWDKGQKMFAAHQTTREKTHKTPQKTRKIPQKNAKKRKSWNLVVLGSFRFFLLFQKSSRFVYPAVVLRFSQKQLVWNKVNHFLVCLTYLLRTTIFSSEVEGRGILDNDNSLRLTIDLIGGCVKSRVWIDPRWSSVDVHPPSSCDVDKRSRRKKKHHPEMLSHVGIITIFLRASF
jgi:hypothetical protein